MANHKYRVKLVTKGACDVEVSRLDINKNEIDNISSEEVEDLLYDGDYILNCGLGNEWNERLELTVYDENDEVVYETNDFRCFEFITEDVFEDADNPNFAILKNVEAKLKVEWENEKNDIEPGLYIAAWHDMKWQEFTFEVEDEEFDPSKLFFINNASVEGLVYDYMTDPWHILYGNEFVATDYCNDSEDEYGTRFFIVEKNAEYGWWEVIREIEY
jgi:hypothetical protein